MTTKMTMVVINPHRKRLWVLISIFLPLPPLLIVIYPGYELNYEIMILSIFVSVAFSKIYPLRIFSNDSITFVEAEAFLSSASFMAVTFVRGRVKYPTTITMINVSVTDSAVKGPCSNPPLCIVLVGEEVVDGLSPLSTKQGV